jgi:dipeptidase
MCDTIVVVGPDSVLFAKNSDRDPNEAQLLEWHPRSLHPSGSRLRCTYLEIPQVEETLAVLISRPFWMWGAEMGTNERGVTIGNEAVFTRQPLSKTGLTGMDLLRLALERAATVREAQEVILRLIQRHGQGGGCGYEERSFTYHNSFLIADPSEAILLETAGQLWAVEVISRGARTISNGLTIPGFTERHSDLITTWGSRCRVRQPRTQAIASRATTAADLMALLRDHGEWAATPRYDLLLGGMAAPCLHGGGLAASSQTTASWVAELRPEGAQHWVTATAAPCTGLFKPVSLGEPLDLGSPTGIPDDRSLFWRHERLHRRAVVNPAELYPLFTPERDRVERRWLADPPSPAEAFAEGDELLSRWTERVESHPAPDVRPWWARRYWAKRAG